MQKLAGNDQKKPMAEVQRELRRLGHRIEPVGGSKDQWEAGMWHMDKEQWNLLWTGEQWACGSLQERTEETELRKWEPMARHQRVLMLLAGVSLFAWGTTMARELARIAALPVLLLMVRRCRTSATNHVRGQQ